MGVLELAEAELGVGLGAVAGDDFGGGPGVPVGDEDAFAEQAFFQGGAGLVVDVPGQPKGGRAVAGDSGGEQVADPPLVGDLADGGGELFVGAPPGRRPVLG